MRLRSTAVATVLFAGLSIPLAGTAFAADTYNCGDFTYQEEAQSVLDQNSSDPNQLDGNDDDGRACESLPSNGSSTTPVTTTTSTTDTSSGQVSTRPEGAVAAGDGSSAADSSALPYVLGGLAFAGAGGAAVAARRTRSAA